MKKRIGIVGGGQLGRMLAQAAHSLGFRVLVLDPTPNAPAGLIADEQIVADFKDSVAIEKLTDKKFVKEQNIPILERIQNNLKEFTI